MSTLHCTSIEHEPPSEKHNGALVLHGGHRGRCSCGWWSDCYAQVSDARRAIEVHLRRVERADFEALIHRSSIGAGIADIKKRGIDAHLVDLEREMRGWRGRARKAKKAKCANKPTPEEAAFLRGFALALATIWRCHHDGQMVQTLLKENSLTLADFRDLDIDNDVEMIRRALSSRRSA